ncbi:MAG: HAMP domain-containing histidine kinase [Alphaproteobacteria bacterium]|nr:HAMP domain-containing histidine kinase [Alphaproteobacteria bacterium]
MHEPHALDERIAELERRTEELSLQHDVDLLITRCHEEDYLCARFLAALQGTAGLGIRTGSAVWLDREGHLLRVTRAEPPPDDVELRVKALFGDAFTHPLVLTADSMEFYAVPIAAGAHTFGALVFRVEATADWTTRWRGILRSAGRAVGGAIERIRLEEERTRMAAELRRARDEAHAASQAKSQFLANMSHELRTPLNAILGYTEMVSDEARDAGHEGYADDLERVLSAGKHLLELIDDLLDLSRIEAGELEVRAEAFALDAVVREVANAVRPSMIEHGNTLVLAAGSGGVVCADARRVRQCLLNLLGNAAKFTRDGEVVVSVIPDGDAVVVEVADTGIGMGEEQLQRVFDAFTQADASYTRRFGGAGLGLALSHRLCAMMGGDLSVVSESGVGTTVRMRLPAG